MNLPVSRRLDFSEIPIIDIGPLYIEDDIRGGASANVVVEKIARACTDVGFFYITNHGIAPELYADVIQQGQLFFNQPDEQKQNILIDQRIRGYLPLYYRSYEGEARAGTSHQEGFWIGHETPANNQRLLDGPNHWPIFPDTLKSAMGNYLSAMENLSHILQKGFARALDLDENIFTPMFDNPTSRLKINHYPPQYDEISETNLGVVPHSDSGAYTILWQDSHGGLEIQNKKGEWVGAPPIDNTFVVNIGNIMQYWSNGKFSSTPHRVVNRCGNDRYSIPFFVNPNFEITIETLVDAEDSKFSPFSYGEYQVNLWKRTFPVANIP